MRGELLIAVFILSIATKGHTQDSLSRELVSKYSYSFSIQNQRFVGIGWDSLRKSIGQSQFVLLGENHSSPMLSEFTAVLLKEMRDMEFRHFIIETGPVASNKLRTMFNKYGNNWGVELHHFLSGNKLKAGCPPAEFIAMKNDIQMYQAAFANRYSVQGIDKEYLYSYKYLLKELRQYCTTSMLRQMHRLAVTEQEHIDSEYLSKPAFKRITQYQNNKVIQEFLNSISSANGKALFIADQMRTSWEIYYLYETGKYYESEECRIRNLKKNFGNYYYEKGKKDLHRFKALIKYGNVHTERGESYLKHLDLGNMVSELAATNGTKSLHLQGMRRYRYNEKGEVVDFLNDGYEVYPSIIAMADTIRWVVIDLVPLKEMLVTGKLKANKEESNLIRKNDYVLLTPIDGAYRASLNYE